MTGDRDAGEARARLEEEFRQRRAAELRRDRAYFVRRVTEIDHELRELEAVPRPAPPPRTPAASAPKAGRGRPRRGPRTLLPLLMRLAAERPAGFTRREAVDFVTRNGYATASEGNFGMIVHGRLMVIPGMTYERESKVYRLEVPPAAPPSGPEADETGGG